MTADKWLDFVRPGEHPSSIITAASAATAIPNMPISHVQRTRPSPHTIQIIAPQPSLTLHLSGSDMSSNQFGLACIKHNKHVRPTAP